ncbi:MAG: ComEC/Rec2 family competence protein [Clostridiales bacterium]|nr:ComEC/Rec2 family competence protein [Clostridiales bacterium]
MKRFVNVRLPVILACALAAGIGLSYVFNFFIIETIWCITVAIFACVLMIILGLTLKWFKPIIFILLALLCFFIGFFNSNAKMENFQKTQITDGKGYFISAEIEDMSLYGNSTYAVLKNLKIDNSEIDGKMGAWIPYQDAQNLDVGYKIEFVAILHTDNTLFEFGELNRNAEKNIKYSCSIGEGIIITDDNPTLFASIRAKIRNTLFSNLDENTAAICYGMMIGDTGYIDSDTMQSFRFGGVAHIFAVSGLHIGLIYAIAYFLLRKIIINSQASLIISVLLIFFYVGICGFTLSSVRAAIMCAVNALTRLTRLKYDGLNSLAFSVIIVLCVTPLSLFSIGYQLSVCAVGGILILSKNIETAMNRAKIPSKISAAAGITFGAQLGTMPIMLSGFGYLSGAGMVMNIVVVPIISALFYFLFVGTVISTVIPVFASALMPIAALPLEGVLSFILILGYENSLITGFGSQLFIPLYYLGILTVSDKLNFKPFARMYGISVALLVLTFYVILKTYSPISGFEITVSAKNSNCVLIKSSSGKVLIIDQTCNSHVDDTLSEYYSNDIDGVIILGGEDCVMTYENTQLKCKDVYIFNLYLNINPYDYATVHYVKEFSVAGIDFTFCDGYSILAEVGGVSVGICSGEIPFTECDLLISKNKNSVCNAARTVYFNLTDYELNTYDYGDISFTVKDNTLKLKTLLRQLTPLNT